MSTLHALLTSAAVEDEKWELEVRKEMARKRGEDVDKPKMTKHQQEVCCLTNPPPPLFSEC